MKSWRAIMLVAIVLAGTTALLAGIMAPRAAGNASPKHPTLSVYSFTMKSLGGKMVHLSQYRGKVILLVNTASKCGFTPQYAGLERLYKTFAKRGLVILGFPSNDFGHQEPGTARQISAFCTQHYGVTFPMFAKVDVKGPRQCALYHYLTARKTDPRFAGVVRWNFEKFLISRRGTIVARFRSPVKPETAIIVAAIKAQLAQ